MFDRAYKDAAFVPRWSIVRKLREQSVAEHSWMVSMYVNDIACHFDYAPELALWCVRAAMWHDVRDEIATGDFPGPNKRMLVKDRVAWDVGCDQIADRIFGSDHRSRAGFDPAGAPLKWAEIVHLTIKVADWLESAVEDATELQLGNDNHLTHFIHDGRETLKAGYKLCEALGKGHSYPDFTEKKWPEFRVLLLSAIRDARYGQSPGPVLAPEMARATIAATEIRARRGDDMHLIQGEGV